jgi:hypothetical protein
MNRITPTTILLACSFQAIFGQISVVAPDVVWNAEIHSTIGMANPHRLSATLTLRGYDAQGVSLGSREIVLGAFQRLELAAKDVFDNASLAWLVLDSTLDIGTFVRREAVDGASLSLTSMVPNAGPELYVPHITKDPQFFSEFAAVNLAGQTSEVYAQPYLLDPEVKAPASRTVQMPDGVLLSPLSHPYNQVRFDYSQYFPESVSALLWDRIHSADEVGLVAFQHFGSRNAAGTPQMATLQLNRSPFHEVVFSHINRDRENFWTSMVLINTFDGILPVEVQSYSDDGLPFQYERFNMAPYEKKVFTINNTNELGLSDVASWFRVRSAERGLIGYEIFGSPNQQVMAALETAPIPTSMCVLPDTPTSDQLWSGVGVLNTYDEPVVVQFAGFDDSGKLIGLHDSVGLYPNQKKTLTLEGLFGEKARQITWTRVDVLRGTISAFSFTGKRDRTTLGAMQGVPVLDLDGLIFHASFEHDVVPTLLDQGWQEYRFFPDYYPPASSFFIERYYEAVHSNHHLGYNTDRETYGFPALLESTALMSPLFEIPNDSQDYYLNFNLRIVDPEYLRPDGKFGIVWREEGSSVWNYHTLSVETLETPVEGDYYYKPHYMYPKHWRGAVHVMSVWWPFSFALPRHLQGKRIQVGPFFHQSIPVDMVRCRREKPPILFWDQITVTPKQLPYYRFDPRGVGTFTVAPDQLWLLQP